MRLNLSDNIPLPAPLTVHIETVNRCNFKCVYCPESLDNYSDLVGGYGVLELPQFKAICNGLRELGGVSVIRLWIMGEPLLNKSLVPMIDYAKDDSHGTIADRIEVTTNASALSQHKIQEIVKSRLDIIKISIYGIGIRHGQITGSKVSDQKILENVKTLKESRDRSEDSKLKIIVKMVDPVSIEETFAFKERYHEFADELEINTPHEWTEDSNSLYLKDSYNDEQLKKIAANLPHRKKICAFPFYTMAIHVNGDVSVCCVDWNKKATVGNIHQETLSEIWNGKALNKFRELHLSDRRKEIEGCKNCSYFQSNCRENIDKDSEMVLRKIRSLRV